MFYNHSDHSTDMNKEVLHSLNEFGKYYSVIVTHHLMDSSSKQFIGKKNHECRFCGRPFPQVSFKSDAHALPHFIGNNKLFTNQECNTCNNKFGRLLETEFAKYMHLNHTVSGVRGKTGFPEFKRHDAKITTTGSFIDWKDIPEENLDFDQTSGVLTVKQIMPTFIPIAVYKCFVKMAMTLMPDEELINFEDTLSWINEEDHKTSIFSFKHLWLLHGNVQTTERFTGISALLVKRRENTDRTQPFMMFRLTYGTSIFQIPLPLSKEDESISHNIVPYIPNLHDLEHGYGKIQFHLSNFNNIEAQKGVEMILKFTDLDGTGTMQYIDESDNADENQASKEDNFGLPPNQILH